MPIYKVQLSDGRTIRLEGDTQPTEDDIYSAVDRLDSGMEKPAVAAPGDETDAFRQRVRLGKIRQQELGEAEPYEAPKFLGSETLGTIKGVMETPLIQQTPGSTTFMGHEFKDERIRKNIEQITQKGSPWEKRILGLQQGVEEFASSLTSPLNIGTAGAFALGKTLARAGSAAFAFLMGKGVAGDTARRLGEIYSQPPEERDETELYKTWTEAILGTGATVAAGGHAALPKRGLTAEQQAEMRDRFAKATMPKAAELKPPELTEAEKAALQAELPETAPEEPVPEPKTKAAPAAEAEPKPPAPKPFTVVGIAENGSVERQHFDTMEEASRFASQAEEEGQFIDFIGPSDKVTSRTGSIAGVPKATPSETIKARPEAAPKTEEREPEEIRYARSVMDAWFGREEGIDKDQFEEAQAKVARYEKLKRYESEEAAEAAAREKEEATVRAQQKRKAVAMSHHGGYDYIKIEGDWYTADTQEKLPSDTAEEKSWIQQIESKAGYLKEPVEVTAPPPKKKRGRPKKLAKQEAAAVAATPELPKATVPIPDSVLNQLPPPAAKLVRETQQQFPDTHLPRPVTPESGPATGTKATGAAMWWDSANKVFRISPERFTNWVNILRDELGFTDERIRKAIRSVLNEEYIHSLTPEGAGKQLWDTMTAFEKWNTVRRYTLGGVREPWMTDDLMGMESIRFQMQRAMRMTPSEYTQMVLKERIAQQSLDILEDVVRGARKIVTSDTERAKLLDRTLLNITAARRAINLGVPPEEVSRHTQIMPDEIAQRGPGMATRKSAAEARRDRERGEQFARIRRMQLEAAGIVQPLPKRVRPERQPDEPLEQYPGGAPITSKTLPAPPKPVGIGEMVMRHVLGPVLGKQGERVNKVKDLVQKIKDNLGGNLSKEDLWQELSDSYMEHLLGATGERLMEFRKALKLEGKAGTQFRRGSGLGRGRVADPDLQAMEDRFAAEQAAGGKPTEEGMKLMLEEQLSRQKRGEVLRRKSYEYYKLSRTAPEKYDENKPDVMTRKQLERIANRLISRAEMIEKGRDIKRAKGVAMTAEERREEKAAHRAQQDRSTLIRNIHDRLMREIIDLRKPVYRKTLSEDDLDFVDSESQYGAGYRFKDWQRNLDWVLRVVRDRARSEASDAASHTRRLLVVADNQTGKVYALSTFEPTKAGESQRIVDPTGGNIRNPHVALNDFFLSKYRPVQSLLLEDPVFGFKKVWDSVREFDKEIGDEAARRSEISGEPPEFAGVVGKRTVPMTSHAEITERPWGRGGMFTGPHASAVRTEAMIEEGGRGEFEPIREPLKGREVWAIRTAVQREFASRITGPTDIQMTLENMGKRGAARTLTAHDRLAIRGFRKIFRSIQERMPNISEADASALMFENIFELYSRHEKPRDFVNAALERFPIKVKPEQLPPPKPEQPSEVSAPRSLLAPESPVRPGYKPPMARPPVKQYEFAKKLSATEQMLLESQIRAKGITREWRDEMRRAGFRTFGEVKAKLPKGWNEAGIYIWVDDPLFKGPGSVTRKPMNPYGTIKSKSRLIALLVRNPTKQEISAGKDYAENWPNNQGRQASNSILIDHLKELQKMNPKAKKFDENMLAGANAVLQSGAWVPKYKLDAEAQVAFDELLDKSKDHAKAMKMLTSQDPKVVEQGHAIDNTVRGEILKKLIEDGVIKHTGIDYEFDNEAGAKLIGFMELIQQGEDHAREMMKEKSFAVRRLGKAKLATARLLRREVEYAMDNWGNDALRNTALAIRKRLDEQYDTEVDSGQKVKYNEDYLMGRYDGEIFNDGAISFGRRRILGGRYNEAKTFKNYYEAIADRKGIYLPVTRNGATLVESRVRAGSKRIMNNVWMDSWTKIKDFETDKPVAVDSIYRGGKWRSPDNYHVPVEWHGKHISVMPAYERLFNQLTRTSAIQDFGPTAFMLEWGQRLKHTLLLGDFFHMGRIGYYGTAILGKRMGWKGGLSVLEIPENRLDDAVKTGVIRQKDADWAKGTVNTKWFSYSDNKIPVSRYKIGNELIRQGLNVGRINDALYKHLVQNVPLFGRYNRWLFDRFTRGLMMEVAVKEFERMNAAHPEVNAPVLLSDIAKDTNKFFGNLGRQGWFKSSTFQDINRIAFLAPQWVEGLIMKEAGLIGRATGFSRLGARAGAPHMGMLGRGMARGLMAMIALTQAINLISRRQPTWKNDDPWHKMDAFIPDPTGETDGFYMSPLSIFNELSHDLIRYIGSKKKTWDAIQQIGENKMGPWGRFMMVLWNAETPYGEKLTTTPGVTAEAAKQLVPMPLTFGKGLQQLGHVIAPGIVKPVPRGQMFRQAVASMGVKIEPGPTSIQAMYQLADRFLVKNDLKKGTGWEQVPTDEPSYSKMRTAIWNHDDAGARRVLVEMLKTHSHTDITKAMQIWLRRGFTGSTRNEKSFKDSLSESEWKTYQDAQQKKQQLYNQWLDWYKNVKLP